MSVGDRLSGPGQVFPAILARLRGRLVAAGVLMVAALFGLLVTRKAVEVLGLVLGFVIIVTLSRMAPEIRVRVSVALALLAPIIASSRLVAAVPVEVAGPLGIAMLGFLLLTVSKTSAVSNRRAGDNVPGRCPARSGVVFWYGALVGTIIASAISSTSQSAVVETGVLLSALGLLVAARAVGGPSFPTYTIAGTIRVVYSAIGAAVLAMGAVGGQMWLAGRLRGPFVNPNTAGLVASVGFVLVVAEAFEEADSRRVRRLLGVAGILAVVMVLTQSRGALLIGTVGSCIAAMARRRERTGDGPRSFMAVGTLVIILLGLAYGIFSARADVVAPDGLAGRYLETPFVDSGRNRLASVAVDLWQERPILGHGYRSADDLFEQRTGLWKLRSAHNGYLQLLVELGLIGAFVVLALPLMAFKMRLTRGLAGRAGMSFLLIALLAGQVAEGTVHAVGNVAFLPFWIAALACIGPAETMSARSGRRATVRRPG